MKTYQGLIKNFKERSVEDADDCYYQYRWEEMSKAKGSKFFRDGLSWITCGYGVRLEHSIGLAISIILIFGLIFLRDVQFDLKEALCISAMVLLSLPLEWRPSKRETYAKVIEDHYLCDL